MMVVNGLPISLGVYLLGQLMVSCSQVTAHYVNEYSDVEADRLVSKRTFFSGGSGVLASGALNARLALRGAWISSAAALVLAGFVAQFSPLAALLGIVALVVSWLYSIPPVRLLGTGWGELVTSIVVTVVVPLIGVQITGSGASPALWWSMLVLLPIHMAMMLIFELPDLETDRAAGKLVLGVRIGRTATTRLISMLIVAAWGLWIGWIAFGDGMVGSYWIGIAVVAAVVLLAISVHQRRNALSTVSAVAILTLAGVDLLLAGLL